MIVTTDCPICDAQFRLDYEEGEPEVRYFRDGTGDPGTGADAEIIDASCDCIEEGYITEERIIEITLERQATAWGD